MYRVRDNYLYKIVSRIFQTDEHNYIEAICRVVHMTNLQIFAMPHDTTNSVTLDNISGLAFSKSMVRVKLIYICLNL